MLKSGENLLKDEIRDTERHKNSVGNFLLGIKHILQYNGLFIMEN
jgi:hypothetical protein